MLGTDEERRPRFTDFHSCLTGNGLDFVGSGWIGWVKHDALIGHGGAQVGDETPLGLSLGSAESVGWLLQVCLFARPEAINLFVEEINTRQVESSTYQLASKSLPMWYHVEGCVSWRQGSNWWPYTRPQFQSQGSGSTTCQLITEGREMRIFAK